MAQIRILSWNVQVYGPQKYGRSPNGIALASFISEVANSCNANVLALVETMSSTAELVAFTVGEHLEHASAARWDAYTVEALPAGNREAYTIFWRTGAKFEPVLDGAKKIVAGVSGLEFPNNFSPTHGRRPAFVTFRTTDTANYFTTTAYHAPPNAQAIIGLEQLAKMPELYAVAAPAAVVNSRLLAGDYNLDVNVQPEYRWLTDPVPIAPPPKTVGEGAGCAAVTKDDTLLIDLETAEKRWVGVPPSQWSDKAAAYLQKAAFDNIFYAPPGAGAGAPVEVLREMTGGSPVARAAQKFQLTEPDGSLAFPNADRVLLPKRGLADSLHTMGCAFLLYRYAISDHLPVLLTATI